MSVRAYLVTIDEKIIDGKKYIYEDEECLWNHSEYPEIWNLLWPIMIDYTNDECLGHIEITYDGWEDLKEDYVTRNSEHGEKIYRIVNQHKNVFQAIDNHFKTTRDDYVKINLY